MKLRNLVCASLLLTIILSGTTYAWDKERRGFVIGLGTGLGSATYKSTTVDGSSKRFEFGRERELAVFTDFEIGYAPTNQFQITYSNVVSWFRLTDAHHNDVTTIIGVGGPVLTYYLRPKSPSLLIGGGFGISTWARPFDSDFDAWSSIGFSGKVGYEFGRSLSLTFHVLGGNPSKTIFGIHSDISILSFGLTLNWLGY